MKGIRQSSSAEDLAELGFCAVAYLWTLVAAKPKSIRETLEALKKSMMEGAPPVILSYSEVCQGVGFNRYWVGHNLRHFQKANASQGEEERYKYNERGLVNSAAVSNGTNGVNEH